MSYYQEGNLARQLDSAISYPAPGVDLSPPGLAEERKRLRREQLQQEAAIRRQYKMVGKVHAKTVVKLVTVFSLIAAVAGFSVWRSAKITEMSFLNAGLRRQINELEEQNILLEDRVSGKASLQVARQQAVEELGMQKATADQILHLPYASLQLGNKGYHDLQALLTEGECAALIEDWVLGR